ncbi:YchJ family protein [Rothia halotolerans]|uniref:YchJ family protein n=1 Tax=Rothia halotolerans TaxID=405770 RepID=UPI00101C6FC3|nr:YchJ family protein [Rothia halotolerans]
MPSPATHPPSPESRCPCGTGEVYGSCCGPLHSGAREAPTAEALMRSRFCAFAVHDAAYLLRTWHPSTRPEELELDGTILWQRLEILGTQGGPFDDAARVRFAAHYRSRPGIPPEERVRGVQREDSRFLREDGRWLYVDGVVG